MSLKEIPASTSDTFGSEVEQLVAQIQQKAQCLTFPVDESVYHAAGLEPTQPILYAGNLKSKLCFFARDLGPDEVFARQPLYGALGALIRQGLYRVFNAVEPTEDTNLEVVLDHVLLTNTVPYKPLENAVYSTVLKQRFRPFLEQLLVLHWKGNQVITLGSEAFKWFAPYGVKGSLRKFFQQPDRYTSTIQVTLHALDSQEHLHYRQFTLLPLPNPSPLNPQYYEQFPQLLEQRLAEIFP